MEHFYVGRNAPVMDGLEVGLAKAVLSATIRTNGTPSAIKQTCCSRPSIIGLVHNKIYNPL